YSILKDRVKCLLDHVCNAGGPVDHGPEDLGAFFGVDESEMADALAVQGVLYHVRHVYVLVVVQPEVVNGGVCVVVLNDQHVWGLLSWVSSVLVLGSVRPSAALGL